MSEAISYEEWKPSSPTRLMFSSTRTEGLVCFTSRTKRKRCGGTHEHDLSADEMAYHEFAGMLADEGDQT